MPEDNLRETGPYVLPRLCNSLRCSRLPCRARLPQLVGEADSELLLAALVARIRHDGPVRHPVHCGILQVNLQHGAVQFKVQKLIQLLFRSILLSASSC